MSDKDIKKFQEIKKLARDFGMTESEVSTIMRQAVRSDDPSASPYVHPSHRIRELEPDASFAIRRAPRPGDRW